MTEPDQRRKVAVVGPYPPFRGGIAHFTEQFHLQLESGGRAPAVAVSFSRQYPGFLFPGESQFSNDLAVQVGVDILIDSVNPFSWGKAARDLVAKGVDEVVFMYWMPFFAPAFLRMAGIVRKAGVKVTAIVHNASPHERQPFGSTLSRSFLSKCDRRIALSESVKRDIESLGIKDRVEVQPHPVYTRFGASIEKVAARRQLGLDESNPTVLFFGLVRKYKGLDILIKALAQTRLQVHLLVAGEWYESHTEIQDLIKDLGLSGRIEIRNQYITDAEVKIYFSAADLLVQPYRAATQSGVVQTAIQFGKPSIVTRVGGLPEMIEDDVNGWIVNPEDPAALALAIDRFFEGTHAERLTLGAVRSQGRFTWEAFVAHFLKED